MKQGLFRGLLGLMALLAAPAALQAQVTFYGALSNFDVINDVGEVHGFEIEFRGVSSVNSYYNWNRYGPPQVVPIPGGGGVYVRWMSPYNPATSTFIAGTPLNANATQATGHSCVMGTAFYASSGCEHFGLATAGNPTLTIYRWLVADPGNPGQLISNGSQVAIPAPVWSVVPPVVPGNPVVVVAAVEPVIPPPPAKLFGPAQWMKTYKTENVRQVNLDELVPDNPVVPNDPAQIETAWDLMQVDLGSNSRQKQKRGALGNGSHAVVRRFEFYKYTGAIDAVTGKALCIDPLCLIPDPSEIGAFIGAQNAAANLNVPASYGVNITVVGDGQVSSPTGGLKCPTVCSTQVAPGTQVTLTAKNGRGIFAGWTGACAGKSLTCTVTVDSDAPVTATFLTPFKLTPRVIGSGTITSNPSGTSFLDGTAVTLTATPSAGNTFTGWSDACTGTATTCLLTMNADAIVTATFSGLVAPPPAVTYRLVLKINGNGSLVASPTGSTFAAGTAVTLTATPGAGVPFVGWTGGGCSGTVPTCTVTMSADTTVQANFR